ncbi:hypothetical protein [Marinivivus vitaminiproducens]|uniref:hypothetical protein n=1 Tax=Marinivivus vitaminiproducens TaxID=3035935 RepID=UPI00279DFD2E|nr:hypothetical protein P4R82_22980 [Geminicoccaceae bacterium SCSIO 64248]
MAAVIDRTTVPHARVRRAIDAVGSVFSALAAARACAAAIESGRKPAARHLTALGIDPAAMDRVRLG